jgi:hypothetical protein
MVESHATDVLTDSIVRVNGTRIPVGDVDVFMRNEGPLDFTRYAEGEFPSPFQDVDYANAFSGFNPTDQDEWDVVTIDVKDYITDNYYRAFTGVVTGVGNASDGGERWMKFRAQGTGQLLNKIPADVSFNDATYADVVKYVVKQANEKVPFEVLSPTADLSKDLRPGEHIYGFGADYFVAYSEGANAIWQWAMPWEDNNKDYHSAKNFHFGKNTLDDVVSWFREKADMVLWFSPTADGVVLLVSPAPLHHHDAHYLGGNLNIVNNDALSELRPLNTVLVKSPAKQSRSSDDLTPNDRGHEQQKASKKFVEAKAIHDELYRRAGNTELHANVERKSDAMTKVEVEQEARKLLAQAIKKPMDGSMQTLLRHRITPYDTVEAKPTCDSSPATNLPSVTYDVARVHHKIRAEKQSGTELNVGVAVDSEEDITVYDSWDTSP